MLLRHLLFAILLLLAQSGALTHGVEHLRIDADAPNHTCAQCLAAQGFDTALISLAPALAVSVATFSLPASVVVPSYSSAAPAPRARAPPTA